VITADVLDLDLGALVARELGATPAAKGRVTGNLPYNISSPILVRLLDAAAATAALGDATLMLQKEVADRLMARPSTREYGVLTLTAALGADVTPLLELPPGAFRPVPRVHSTVVRLAFRPHPPEVHDSRLVVDIVRAIFTQRRKMLSNALASFASARGLGAHDVLRAAGVDSRRRPETLELAEVARLADEFAR
jgi:16S rRNA (adenine1518-N6/adenine1519-N6)-dimethyltransferase